MKKKQYRALAFFIASNALADVLHFREEWIRKYWRYVPGLTNRDKEEVLKIVRALILEMAKKPMTAFEWSQDMRELSPKKTNR